MKNLSDYHGHFYKTHHLDFFPATPLNITVDDIVTGTSRIPPILNKFLQYLIGGPDSRSWSNQAKKRRIKSIGEDLVFATSSGRKLPGKHLKLGIAVNSLTGIRKVIEMALLQLPYD